MKLITEHYDDFEILTEGKNGKDMKIKGVFMQAETKNRNGRVYPMDVLDKEVKNECIICMSEMDEGIKCPVCKKFYHSHCLIKWLNKLYYVLFTSCNIDSS